MFVITPISAGGGILIILEALLICSKRVVNTVVLMKL